MCCFFRLNQSHIKPWPQNWGMYWTVTSVYLYTLLKISKLFLRLLYEHQYRFDRTKTREARAEGLYNYTKSILLLNYQSDDRRYGGDCERQFFWQSFDHLEVLEICISNMIWVNLSVCSSTDYRQHCKIHLPFCWATLMPRQQIGLFLILSNWNLTSAFPACLSVSSCSAS